MKFVRGVVLSIYIYIYIYTYSFKCASRKYRNLIKGFVVQIDSHNQHSSLKISVEN